MTRFSQISKTDTNGAQFSYRHGNHPFETKFVVTWHSQICWLFFLELSKYKSISPIQRHMKSQSRSHSRISEPIHSLLNCRFNWESWELCGLCHSVRRWRWIRGGQQPLGTRETRRQRDRNLVHSWAIWFTYESLEGGILLELCRLAGGLGGPQGGYWTGHQG